jgi:mannose-6-phosphate isomerase
MPVTQLTTITVAKPWGRHRLWPGFADPAPNAEPVGEIWFDAPGRDLPLLVKYLFTSERLSVQVHPDDALAQATGHKSGKEECWIILDAEPDAVIGIGTHKEMDGDALRATALDGSIVDVMIWHPVTAGDVILVPPGTIHAIGAGVTLIEVQQNIDLTYRLYDYGRPRELHLDEGIASAVAQPFAFTAGGAVHEGEIAIGKHFRVSRHHAGAVAITTDMAWIVPITGTVRIDGVQAGAGECWLIEGRALVQASDDSDWLIAEPLA